MSEEEIIRLKRRVINQENELCLLRSACANMLVPKESPTLEAVLQTTQERDQLKSQLAIAVQALDWYAERAICTLPDDWNHFKEGGHPEVGDLLPCADIAANALSRIQGEGTKEEG